MAKSTSKRSSSRATPAESTTPCSCCIASSSFASSSSLMAWALLRPCSWSSLLLCSCSIWWRSSPLFLRSTSLSTYSALLCSSYSTWCVFSFPFSRQSSSCLAASRLATSSFLSFFSSFSSMSSSLSSSNSLFAFFSVRGEKSKSSSLSRDHSISRKRRGGNWRPNATPSTTESALLLLLALLWTGISSVTRFQSSRLLKKEHIDMIQIKTTSSRPFLARNRRQLTRNQSKMCLWRTYYERT